MAARVVLFLIGGLLIAGVAVALLGRDREGHQPRYERAQYHEDITGQRNNAQANSFRRTDLVLPFSLGDIHPSKGVVNPLGIVRFSKDKGHTGHGGIDFPLTQGSPIYAVADGLIVIVKSANDPWGGQGIYQLLGEPFDYVQGEGWAFLYEHVTPTVSEGDFVRAGDVVATKASPDGFTAHFQLSYNFNDYQYTRDPLCWPEYLVGDEFTTWWDEHRSTPRLQDAWRGTFEEGAYPFRGLLDLVSYPAGPQLCYPLGTDVR